MRIVPKAQYGRQLVAESDNTRVARPVLVERMEYKPRPDEFFITDRRTGKKVLVKRKNETISTDRRTIYQRKQDEKRTQQLHRQYEEDKKQEEGMRNLQGFLTFVSPSTYVGPVFNNNGKSYVENVMSGEGTGNVAGNAAIDILTPTAIGGVRSLASRGLKYLFPTTKLYSDNSVVNAYTTLARRYNLSGKARLPYPYKNFFYDPVTTAESKFVFSNQVSQPGQSLVQRISISPTSNNSSDIASDALYLHFERLKNGGYDKLEKQLKEHIANNPYADKDFPIPVDGGVYMAPFVRKDLRNPISIRTPKDSNSITPEEDLIESGGAIAWPTMGVIEYSPDALKKQGYSINRALSHELDHAIHIPLESPQGFDIYKLPQPIREYFHGSHGTELSARGSQIKDWLRFNRADQNITESDLKNAAQNYIKETGMNNNMTDFFNSITDYKKAAKWLSKYSTGLTVPIILDKNQKEN